MVLRFSSLEVIERFPDILFQCKNLILDISSVTHVDSAACQDIVGVYKHFKELEETVHFVGIRGSWRSL